jgi:hypothetical protein
MNEPSSVPPRGLRLGIGVLAALVAVLTLLGTCVWLALWGLGVVATPSLPALVLVILVQSLYVSFWILIAYRLLYNRPNRQGGLFSSSGLYATAVFSGLAAVALIFAPASGDSRDGLALRLRGVAVCLTLAVPAFYLARRRAASQAR